MDFLTRYAQLNSQQKKAVDTIDGPVMVVAGPGTGKTELLSVRIANILKNTDTLPQSILCLTFTDSGAAAMRERLLGIIGKDAYKVAIHTFHSFGSEVINQNREYFYQGAEFQPADDITRYEIVRNILAKLDHNSPLSSTMNGEFTHQADVTRTISDLKRSGLTSDELRAVLEQNDAALNLAERIIIPHFDKPIKKGLADALASDLKPLADAANDTPTLYEIVPLARTLYDSLVAALDAAATEHPTKPLTAWKKQWLSKDSDGKLVFSARKHITKLRAVSYVYYEYMQAMERASLFDYDDMILQVVHAVEVHDDLRYSLQEKYLYVLVDEFQDTNLAQMRILNSLTDTVTNDDPNILVVGDDDQAIYSFQGADISNILRFRELYPQATVITLTDNYRSQASILNGARDVIIQGGERLETIMADIDKTLTAHRSGEATVALTEHHTQADERAWIADQVHAAIASGTAPQEIAILTKKHAELQELVPYLHAKGIRVQYDRHDNALESEPVVAVTHLAAVIMALADGEHEQADGLLPELLAHPAWGFTPQQLWKLSVTAYDSRTRWMDTMATTPDFVAVHEWLTTQAATAKTAPLEPLLDTLLGKPVDEATDAFRSPLYNYFFSQTRLEQNPQAYLDYLTAISAIRAHVREYGASQHPTLATFMTFIGLHKSLGTPLSLNRHILEGDDDAVHLMTAHASKGLEFETVFLINATDATWGEKARGRSRLIAYPDNMPLAPAGNTPDERLRLFYVAMTRAKNQLTISYASETLSGKHLLRASFLSTAEASVVEPTTSIEHRTAQAEAAWFVPLVQPSTDLKTLLKPRLERYKLSATHLNRFVDVMNGGPQSFLLDNLLHFPSAKSDSARYGSAIHRTLQNAHTHRVATGEQKPAEDILHDFEEQLKRERIPPTAYEQWLQKGSEHLQAFLTQKPNAFTATQRAELNFSTQDVHVGDAHITGLLDVADIHTQQKTMVVTDYKTGKPIKDGKTRTEYEKVKLYKYQQQLLFYKLLVERSRDFQAYTVTDGIVSFVEPTQSGEIVDSRATYSPEAIERTEKLIQAVWNHITSLTLPDISDYEPTLKGIIQFEDDLIATL